MKKMFLAIEVNLVLWIALVGALWLEPRYEGSTRTFALIGAGFAALFQHWAYYQVHKSRLREKAD